MGTSCSCDRCSDSLPDNFEYPENELTDFDFPIITEEDMDTLIKEMEKEIKKLTGFTAYNPQQISLNPEQKEIKGTYYQYNRGCILYALINNGWVDEKYIPDSLKHYKNHSHRDEERNDVNLLKKIISIIDLAQLWINIGGECPYLEIDLKEAKYRLYSIFKDYLKNPETKTLQKVEKMTWQSKDYFELMGALKDKIEITPLKSVSIIQDNPCMKKAIDEDIIKKRDIIKYGRHCFIFDGMVERNSKKMYSFQDSLAYFRQAKDEDFNSCEFDKESGYIFAADDTKFINKINTDEMDIVIIKVKI